MSIKRKKNCDELQHVEKPCETSLSFIYLDEFEVFHPYSSPVNEVKEENSLNNEEFEGPVEAALASILPAHGDKEMVILSCTNGIMK
jgi:hypothetical protein